MLRVQHRLVSLRDAWSVTCENDERGVTQDRRQRAMFRLLQYDYTLHIYCTVLYCNYRTRSLVALMSRAAEQVFFSLVLAMFP
jgi:hypothetical protein